MKLSSKKIFEFQKTILDSYEARGRKFPWRETRDPYAILVSEIMLQQTQTERVIPKYNEWLSRFPTARSLASAPLAEVLALWSGLGYNRRARYLHEAAKQIARDGFPSTADELKKLPGIGAYTAGAVITFAHNSAEVFIETNIRSVFIFFFFKSARKTEDAPPVRDCQIIPLIEQTLFRKSPRRWYYALMDYGAALKKKTMNPSRMSAHYTKQSKFKGSVREARGAIIRSITTHGKSSIEQIAQRESIEYDRLKKAADSLVAENFICQDDGGFFIT
jgi:A/G-specific adenine glycosylase